MPTYEELIAAGAQPVGAPPAPPAGGLTLEQLQAMGAQPVTAGAPPAPAPPAPKPVSQLESFGRGALQGASLGLSDEITGALESLFTDKTYVQARDEARANNEAAEKANPLTYGAGNLAGSVLPSFIPGAAVAEGASALNAAGKAAAMGAAAGFGTSNADLTKGDVAGVAKDVGTSALLGGAVGGILHGIGARAASKSQQAFEKDANADLFGKARPKDALQANRVQQANPETFREVFYGDDFKPVLDLARSGKTEQAVDAAQDFVDNAAKNRLSNYEAASADGATGTTGSVVQRLQQEASAASATTGRAEEGKAIRAMADAIKDSQSVVDAAKLPPELQFKGLPAQPTKGDLWKAAQEAQGVKTAGAVDAKVANAIEGLKFQYDPEAKIPLLKLRQITTSAQNSAAESLGTIAETERARITGAVEKATNDALEQHLDNAALTSAKAAKAVEAIRHDDKVISMGLAAKEGLAQKLVKESTGKGASLGERVSQGVTKAAQFAGIGLLGHGDPVTGLALEAAPFALKAASAGARRANDTLARLIYAEKMGNTYARNVLTAIRQTPQGAARLAAMQAPQGAPQ